MADTRGFSDSGCVKDSATLEELDEYLKYLNGVHDRGGYFGKNTYKAGA